MRVSLFYVQQNRTKNADAFEEHYLKKIKKNMSLQIIGIANKKKFTSQKQQIKYEGDLIRKKIGNEKYICFDKCGVKVCSKSFANMIYKSNEKVNLVVGGAFGLSDDVAENASKTISFSDMEFSHEVFRVMLLEQVYRANCIFNNHPYHQS
ncbi:MAG: 23S rRNA (pseudouridine(1915)-N(3))-methyltransferase RlmH [Gammaproteobacteria bacterium TMED112]|nr:MAG: 23S rRNA (pseudouridine(1915)-N(3))-methyltransferase RlmH [Gammaproteobacteria bacterium TMED112]|tara:strand:+ start:20732 stop:21184 length:453 start_codon:yes stop_codon:yes gene_type:complete